MPQSFEPPIPSRAERFTFPAPFPTSTTNFSTMSHHFGKQGGLRNLPPQSMSVGPNISQGGASRFTSQTLFPKPIDVVALLSGADQFSNRQDDVKQQSLGLPGPMQLFSTLSISEDGRGNVNTNRNSSDPFLTTSQEETNYKVRINTKLTNFISKSSSVSK